MSDRILIVTIASKPFNIVIVHMYAPTSTSPEDEIEKFYDDLDAAYKMCGSQEMKIVMGGGIPLITNDTNLFPITRR